MSTSLYEKIIEGADNFSKYLASIRLVRLKMLERDLDLSLEENNYIKERKGRFYALAIISCIAFTISCHAIIYYLIYSLIPVYENIYQYTICEDGFISYSNGQGSCSWHGGIAEIIYRKVEIINKSIYLAESTMVLLLSIVSIVALFLHSKAVRKIAWLVLNWFGFTYPLIFLWVVYFCIAFAGVFLIPFILVLLTAFYFFKFFVLKEIAERIFDKK